MKRSMSTEQNQVTSDIFKRYFWGLVMHGYKYVHRGNLNVHGKFLLWKLVMHGHKNVYEGDLNENDNFNVKNRSCLVTTFYMGTILTKMAILEMGN